LKYGGTTIIHPGPLMKGYYAIVDLSDKEVVAVVGKLD